MFSLFKEKPVFTSIILIFIAIFTYLKVIHQDDGWYAIYAMRILTKFNLSDISTVWDFTDANGDKGLGGFLFPSAQAICFVLFGINNYALKILHFTLGSLLFLSFAKLTENLLGHKVKIISSCLLVFLPYFQNHLYNRPEMFATLIMIISLMLLTGNKISNKNITIAFLLPVLAIDLHPISIFIGLGFYFYFFYKNINKSLFILGGSLLGILIYLIGNYFVAGSLGLFEMLSADTRVFLNDHYVPLFDITMLEILQIQVERYSFHVKFLLASGLLFYGVYYMITKKYKHINIENLKIKQIEILMIMAPFFIFSAFLTEAVGNGFGLYSLVIFVLFFTYLYVVLSLNLNSNIKLVFFIVPTLICIKTSGFALIESYNKKKYFDQNYHKCLSIIPPQSKLLIRPTFSFLLANNSNICEPLFPISSYMLMNNKSFAQSISDKNFDILCIDEMFLNDFFIGKEKISRGPYYEKLKDIGISETDYAKLIENGIFKPLHEYNDPYHGNSIFYRVDQLLLKDFLKK